MGPRLRTFVLMVVLAGLLMLIGSFWGTSGVITGFIIALGLNLLAWWRSASTALKSMNARPVTEEELPQVYAIVRELSQKAGKPMPSIHLAPTAQPNAFATGRSPKNAAVCVTTGILERLDSRQLRAVLGHELGHVYNWDILINSIAATFASAIMFIANMAQWGAVVGTPQQGNKEPSRFALLMIAIFGPLAATVVRMAIGRGRELGADHSGGVLSDDPLALASALETIERGVLKMPMVPSAKGLAQAHMMLFNPFKLLGWKKKLFSTHPPTELRVEKMQELAKTVDPNGNGPDYPLPPAAMKGLPLSAAEARALEGSKKASMPNPLKPGKPATKKKSSKKGRR
jgi:heat shock protein HtpX